MRQGWRAGVLLFALGACTRLPAPLPSPVPGVAVRRTALPRYVELVGPKRQHAPPFLGVPETNFFILRSWLDRRTGRAVTQLYVSDSYRGPERRWDAARGPDGTTLPFTAINREQINCRGGCAWTEDFAAGISARALAAAQGFAVTFSARSGARMTIAVTPRQLRLQRAAIAAVRAMSPGYVRAMSPGSAVDPVPASPAPALLAPETGSGSGPGWRGRAARHRPDHAAG